MVVFVNKLPLPPHRHTHIRTHTHTLSSARQLSWYWNDSLGNKSHFDWLVIAEDRSMCFAGPSKGYSSHYPPHTHTHTHTHTQAHTQWGPWTSRETWYLIGRISKHELLIVPMQINNKREVVGKKKENERESWWNNGKEKKKERKECKIITQTEIKS